MINVSSKQSWVGGRKGVLWSWHQHLLQGQKWIDLPEGALIHGRTGQDAAGTLISRKTRKREIWWFWWYCGGNFTQVIPLKQQGTYLLWLMICFFIFFWKTFINSSTSSSHSSSLPLNPIFTIVHESYHPLFFTYLPFFHLSTQIDIHILSYPPICSFWNQSVWISFFLKMLLQK